MWSPSSIALAGCAILLSTVTAQQGQPLSDSCSQYLKSQSGDAELNNCFRSDLLSQNVASLAQDMQSSLTPTFLHQYLTQFCSVETCPQSQIDQIATDLRTNCAVDISGGPGQNAASLLSFVATFYTAFQKSSCYVDADGEFCLVKDAASLQTNLNSLNSLSTALSTVGSSMVCSTCNQHIIGTYLQAATGNPSLNATSDDIAQTVEFFSQKCGTDYGNGLTNATNAPFPNVQPQSSGTAPRLSNPTVLVIFAACIFVAVSWTF